MKIAVVGCLHGELDIIYEQIQQMEQKQNITVDLLLVCGDFQAVRNKNDLKCMAVPDKHKRLGTFYKYYFGEKTVPKLTILIGGNHEASNYMQTLPFGGWVAPNMYYLGYCSLVNFAGLRIGGISGIFKPHDSRLGHYECLPYDNSSMRSVYHMRETEIFRLMQLSKPRQRPVPETTIESNNDKKESDVSKNNRQTTNNQPLVDVFMSHDWPINIHQCGNVKYLLSKKPFFREEVERGQLGNRLLSHLVNHFKPRYWFAAHLHVGFRATVNHQFNDQQGKSISQFTTQFQALDKVLPNRNFLQIFDIPVRKDSISSNNQQQSGQVEEEESQSSSSLSSTAKLQYDAEWLAILRKTDYLTSVKRTNVTTSCLELCANEILITDEDIEQIYSIFNNDLTIPENFAPTEPVLTIDQDLDPRRQCNYLNAQTTRLCNLLQINDPNQMLIDLHPENRGQQQANLDDNQQVSTTSAVVKNPDEIDLNDSDSETESNFEQKRPKIEPNDIFFLDTKGSR